MHKALRGGVQDVAVKQLQHADSGELEHFMEVNCTIHIPCTAAAEDMKVVFKGSYVHQTAVSTDFGSRCN